MIGCEIHRVGSVDSTNRLAAAGKPGEVFVAAEQTAGRGRLDHRWHSRPGENLLMSTVIDVTGIAPAEAATIPLVAGLSVVKAIKLLAPTPASSTGCLLKWPNDVYLGSRKVSGILCERHGDNVIVGVGLNVRQREFPETLKGKATSLALSGIDVTVAEVLEKVLESLFEVCAAWRRGGFAALHPGFAEIDFLRGREVSVWRTDDDSAPVRGICRGISSDGSLRVGDTDVYAGEVRY